MTDLETILRGIQSELDGLDKRWALVGGLAVVVRGEPRFTRDADLAVAVLNDTEAETLALKVLSRDDVRRPTDLADLRSLLAQASPADLDEAERSLFLIAERGYHRDRDLPRLFRQLLEDHSPG